jgi:hypothetical protein
MSVMSTSTIAGEAQALIAAMRPGDRLARAAALNRAADALALAGLRHRKPLASPALLQVELALQRLGRSGDAALRALLEREMSMSDEPANFLGVALRAATVCTALGIPYLIGGGVAATVHGEFRTTRDVDLVVRLRHADAVRFAEALAADFILNPPDIIAALRQLPQQAIDRRQRATFAAYDRASGYQLDVYCAGETPFERVQFVRALAVTMPEIGTALMIASPEDTILAKLEWYAITPSDRQWDDVRTIIRVQGDALDTAYIAYWAEQLGVAEVWDAAQRGEHAPHHRPNAHAGGVRQRRLEL